MARYYFHLIDSRNEPDEIGLDLPNLEAAKIEALSFAGAILRDERPIEIWQGQPWKMTVTDDPRQDHGTTLLTLALIATDETV